MRRHRSPIGSAVACKVSRAALFGSSCANAGAKAARQPATANTFGVNLSIIGLRLASKKSWQINLLSESSDKKPKASHCHSGARVFA